MCVLVVVRLLVMVIDWLVLLMNLKGGKFSNDSVVVSVLFVWKIKFVKGNCFLSWGICMVELVKFICLFWGVFIVLFLSFRKNLVLFNDVKLWLFWMGGKVGMVCSVRFLKVKLLLMKSGLLFDICSLRIRLCKVLEVILLWNYCNVWGLYLVG